MKLLVCFLSLVLRFKGTVAPCHNTNPTKTWPLGQGILNREIISNDPPEYRGIFGYMPTNLGYSGMQFYGNSSSFADVLFDGSNDDYTLYTYINPTMHGGCILHYKSFSSLETGITEYRLDMNSDGTLTFSVKTNGVILVNDGQDTGLFIVPLNQWSIIKIEFDISKTYAEIQLDDGSEMKENVIAVDTVHVGPGITRIASPQDGVGSSFKGGISCLHYIERKDICVNSIYESKCISNWPSTSTQITTTTSSTTTSTSITYTSTTSTTMPSTTSTSTTSTTMPSTTSTSTMSTTMPSTTSTPTTSTTMPSTTSTSTTTSSSTTTSTSKTTSTTMMSYMPTTSNVLSTSISQTVIQTGWRRCNKLATSTTFTDSSDVISVKPVGDVRDCLMECNKFADCIMFALIQSGSNLYMCKTGKAVSSIQYGVDSSMYVCEEKDRKKE